VSSIPQVRLLRRTPLQQRWQIRRLNGRSARQDVPRKPKSWLPSKKRSPHLTKKDLAEQQDKLKLDNADAEAKIGDAIKATGAAEAELKKKNEAYEKYMEALTKEGKVADEASQKRLEEYNKAIDELNEHIKTQEEAKAAAEQSLKDNHEAYMKDKKERKEAYDKEVEAAKKKGEEMEESFKKEEKEHAEKFDKEFTSNKEKYEAELTKLKSEKEANIKAAKEAKAEIKKDYDAKEKAAKEAEEDYQKVKADEAQALSEKRDAKKKATEEQAAADEKAYKEEMEKVADDVADAKKADTAQKTFASKAASAQKIREGLSAEEYKKDEAIAKCEDNVQCMDKDTHECKDLSADGPYLADDLVHCQDEKGDVDNMSDTDAVDDWMGGYAIGAEPTPPPVVPSKECLARIDAMPEAAKTAYAAWQADHTINPLEYLLCTADQSKVGHFEKGSLTNEEMEDELIKVFDMLDVCPDICFPDTAETVTNDNGSVTSDESICIANTDWAALKAQVINIPHYDAQGTKIPAAPKGRFPAGQSTTMCTFVTAMAEGFRGGAGTDSTPGEDTLAQAQGGKGNTPPKGGKGKGGNSGNRL